MRMGGMVFLALHVIRITIGTLNEMEMVLY